MFREISEFNLDLCSSAITNPGREWFTGFASSLPKEQSAQFLYDFSSFVSSKTKIRMKDKHTNIEYTQYPSNHLKGSKPSEAADRGKSVSYYLEEFKRVHGDKFDYSGVI